MQERYREGPGPIEGTTPDLEGDQPAAKKEAAGEVGRGRRAWRPYGIQLVGWRDIIIRSGRRVGPELFPLLAAGIAFFGMLSLFPAIAMLAALAGMVFEPDLVVDQIDAFEGVVPPEPLTVVRDQAVALAGQATGQATATALFSLALSLFWASRGIDNLVSGINLAHAEAETRSIVVRNFISLWLTGILAIMALGTIFVALIIPPWIETSTLSGWNDTIATVGRWPLLAMLSMLSLGMIYRHAPARRPPRWSWVTPGAVIGTALWLGGSWLFFAFVRNIASYQPTYGTLAGVVILLLYIWLTAFVVLLGALLNAEMEHQTARDTTRGKVRPMGKRDARMADTLGRKP
ncbi:YihY/virulence factor BrkB family protein [Loktanella sp. SALINAS62]|uniref:YihY/virulence factor BrkB family protein n=1 Tax=Loktanella sp. SALINAS62 TaxID=2706124 RepID=UPI001B8D9CCD|nr:YihY/virulence factor BrkB family protein [Loktanella sp. SALINAS62]MBS1302698.1 YihY/virulence factor BrkB family protein [Loktanella sp. SALINAS62]